MAVAMGANSSDVPLKRARTRRMISALSTRTSGSLMPGFEMCSSGKLTNVSTKGLGVGHKHHDMTLFRGALENGRKSDEARGPRKKKARREASRRRHFAV